MLRWALPGSPSAEHGAALREWTLRAQLRIQLLQALWRAHIGPAAVVVLAADVTASPLLPRHGAIGVREVSPEESLVGAHPLPEGLEERWRLRLDAMCRALAGRGAHA